MEKIDENIILYENNIELLIDEFKEKYDIIDLTKESQNRWNALLSYIYKHTFKLDNSLLKENNNIANKYNIPVINKILNIYIDLCNLYSKEISIIGFSNLTGIDPDTFYNWGNKECMVNEKGFEIYKKLKRTHEESLGNMLASGKNPVGILGILNHRFGWNTANTIEVKPAIAKQTPQEIAKQYGVDVEQIAQKEIEIELPPTNKN